MKEWIKESKRISGFGGASERRGWGDLFKINVMSWSGPRFWHLGGATTKNQSNAGAGCRQVLGQKRQEREKRIVRGKSRHSEKGGPGSGKGERGERVLEKGSTPLDWNQRTNEKEEIEKSTKKKRAERKRDRGVEKRVVLRNTRVVQKQTKSAVELYPLDENKCCKTNGGLRGQKEFKREFKGVYERLHRTAWKEKGVWKKKWEGPREINFKITTCKKKKHRLFTRNTCKRGSR